MKKNAKHADSLYILLKPKLFHLFSNKDNTIRHLKTFAECSIIGSILVYFVSTIILLLRNLVSGLPFAPLSIIQAVVITVYFCLLVGGYIVAEHIICGLWQLSKTIHRSWKKVSYVFLVVVICLLITFAVSLVLSLFFRNVSSPFFIIILLCIIPSVNMRFACRSQDKMKSYIIARMIIFFVMLTALSIIWSLPASVGGLGSQKVAYRNSSGLCQEYDYYGVSDGMLVLKNDDKVSLIPVGDGYIEYIVPKYSFLSSTKDEQKGCEAVLDNPAPEAE